MFIFLNYLFIFLVLYILGKSFIIDRIFSFRRFIFKVFLGKILVFMSEF